MSEKFTPIPEQISNPVKETRGLRTYDMVVLASTLTTYSDKNKALNQFLEFAGHDENDVELINNSLKEIVANRDKYPVRYKSIDEVFADQESGYMTDRAVKALHKMREISNTKDNNWELLTCAFNSIDKEFEFNGIKVKDSLEYIEKIVKDEVEYNPDLNKVIETPKPTVVFIIPEMDRSVEIRKEVYNELLEDYFDKFMTIDSISGARLTHQYHSLTETYCNKMGIENTKKISIVDAVFLRYCFNNIKGGLNAGKEKSIRKEIEKSYSVWLDKKLKNSN